MDFSWRKVNVTPTCLEQCSRLQQSRWCCHWFLAAYTAAVTHNAFLCAGQPQNCFFWWEIWIPIWHVVPWVHQSLPSNRHLDRFSRFCRTHTREKQTDRHTDRPRYSVCSIRLHLAIAAMRPESKYSLTSWWWSLVADVYVNVNQSWIYIAHKRKASNALFMCKLKGCRDEFGIGWREMLTIQTYDH